MILGRSWEAFPFYWYFYVDSHKKIMCHPLMIPDASWELFPLFPLPTSSSLLSHTTSSHFFHSLLLSKSIRSLTAFLGQSEPISASSFKHICHTVRSEDVLTVHTQRREQTGILTSSRADLSEPLIVNPAPLWAQTPTPESQNLQLACLCTPWHGRLI